MSREDREYMQSLATKQTEFCKENGLKRFAPYDGLCPRCNNQIYERFTPEEAEDSHISYCPFCYADFTD